MRDAFSTLNRAKSRQKYAVNHATAAILPHLEANGMVHTPFAEMPGFVFLHQGQHHFAIFVHRENELGVVEVGSEIGTAPRPTFRPLSPRHALIPGFVKREEGGIGYPTNNASGELPAKIIEAHPKLIIGQRPQ